MKKNTNLLFLCGLVAFIVLLLGFEFSRQKTQQTSNQETQTHHLMDVASGDTNDEVLKTIIANQKKLEKENKVLAKDNTRLRENRAQAIRDAVNSATNSLKSDIDMTKRYLEKQIQGQKIPVDTATHTQASQYRIASDAQTDTGVIRTVEDVARQGEAITESANKHVRDELPSHRLTQQANQDKVTPYYTLPANSTLNNVYLMSAIIAEVPVSNKLLEPAFPFKAIIGKHDLMAANGAHLPSDIAGAVVSGYSVGNMTMSCARSYVMQILFVFADGNSFTVYPEKINREASDLYPHDALGYMSDPYGNTCIAGKYITNAPKVLATYAALGGISATGQALAQAQLSTLSNSFETTQNLTGNIGKYAAGEFLNGASQKSLEWYSQRVSGSFDAVYIPASFKDKQGAYHVTHLTLNLSQTIPIDLNQKARKMINENSKDHSRSVTLD